MATSHIETRRSASALLGSAAIVFAAATLALVFLPTGVRAADKYF